MPTTISREANLVTLINTFTVAPERQDELVRVLVDATEEVIRHQPGFVSANIHRGLDGTHVANYAQWRSTEDFEAMLANPDCQVHLRQAADLASFQPLLYTVVDVTTVDA
jgi:heme-degrading monooxygenase HmoA